MHKLHNRFQFFILFFSVLILDPLHAHYAHISFSPHVSHQTHDRAFKSQHDFSLNRCDNNGSDRSSVQRHQFSKHTTTKDFQKYFTQRGYTENQILNQRCLYMFDDFVKFAQTYSSYKCTIQQLHAELKNLTLMQKFIYRCKGTYCWGLQKRIHFLHDQLNTLKTAQQGNDGFNNNHSCMLDGSINYTTPHMVIKDCSLETFPTQLTEYKTLESVYRAYTPSLANAIQARADVYSTITTVDYSFRYASKSYNLDNNIKQLLSKYGHDTERFTHYYGNPLEHAIHQESLNLLDRIDSLPRNSLLHDHQEALVDFTVAMADYNHEGLTDKAMDIGDLCWTLLDYGQAVAEGVALGAYSAVTDIVSNPIEATACIVAGKYVLAYQLSKVLYNVADIGVTAITNFDGAKEKWNKYAEPLNNIIDAINKKEITLRDAVKGGTAFVVGYKAQGKLLGGLGKFCGTIKHKSINFIKNSPLLKPQEYLTTPEGLLFKATAQSNKLKQTEQCAASNLKNNINEKLVKNKNIIPIQKKGSLIIEQGGKFSESEKKAAEYMCNLGNDVILRAPKGTRVEAGTSDLLVNGINYDVYTPITTNPSRIISAIAAKKDQATGIVLDLSQTNVTLEQLGNIKARLIGKGINNISDIIVLK